MPQKQNHNDQRFVQWFRDSSPYIKAFRGRTFVITFGGEQVADEQFAHLAHDIALLNSLGVQLILVHGIRPQVERKLRQQGAEICYANGLRITDDKALVCVKEAAGSVRVEIEALLSMGLANSPMARARIRVASGNFVTAQPLGIRDGIDYLHTGEVRRLDVSAMEHSLDNGNIVLLSPIGYSPTGEVFNLTAAEVAHAAATAIKADKLICLTDSPGLLGGRKRLIRQLTLTEAENYLTDNPRLSRDSTTLLSSAVKACKKGVRRVHLVDRHIDGGLLLELFTRDGVGTMVCADLYEGARPASIEDVGGILELIAPLEADGILVRRSRELLETEIQHFTVMERDGMIIACAALYPYLDEHIGELACLAVHPDYSKAGRGQSLLEQIEHSAKQQGIQQLFVLTTHAPHWFRERSFRAVDIKALPVKRKLMYNYQRNSKAYVKLL